MKAFSKNIEIYQIILILNYETHEVYFIRDSQILLFLLNLTISVFLFLE